MKTGKREEKRFQERRRKKIEKRRRRYKEIRGKKVDWIHHYADEGLLVFDVQFMDGTNFTIQYSQSDFVLDMVSYADASSGDLKVIKDYFLRRGN